MTRPLVTVGVPCHNARDHLDEALRSAVVQTYANLQIVVVDDGSTDGSADLAAALGDDRIEVELSLRNRGVSATRQRIIELARGDLLVWLDSDDVFDADRIERLVDAAESTGADVVIDGARYVDERGHPLPGRRAVTDAVATDPHFTRLFERNVMPPHPLVRRRAFCAIAYDPAIRTSEDYDVWLRYSRLGARFHRVDGDGMDYRVREGSLSAAPDASRRALRTILRKHPLAWIEGLYRARGFDQPAIDRMYCLQHIHRGNLAAALVRALEPWPDDPSCDRDFYIGTLALACGNTRRAAFHLERHLERDPASPAGLNNLGVLVSDRGGDGDPYFVGAATVFPGYADAPANLEGRRSLTPTQLDRGRPR